MKRILINLSPILILCSMSAVLIENEIESQRSKKQAWTAVFFRFSEWSVRKHHYCEWCRYALVPFLSADRFDRATAWKSRTWNRFVGRHSFPGILRICFGNDFQLRDWNTREWFQWWKLLWSSSVEDWFRRCLDFRQQRHDASELWATRNLSSSSPWPILPEPNRRHSDSQWRSKGHTVDLSHHLVQPLLLNGVIPTRFNSSRFI